MTTNALTALTHQGQPLALVPSHALSWHRVQLPAGSLPRGWMHERGASRLRNILEGLLEEQVLDEPAQLHFALPADASTGKPVWVAVCDKTWLRDAVLALEQTGVHPTRLVPEWTPDHPEPHTLWLTGTPEAAYVVWTDAAGLHRLPIHIQQPLPAQLPEDLLQLGEVWAEPAMAPWAEHWFERPVTVRSHTERLALAADTPWDLAQMDLARRNPWLQRCSQTLRNLWQTPLWRPARWALGALVAIQVLGLNAYAWRAQHTLAEQRDAIRNTLVSTFPHVKLVLDAPLQMQRELATLRQSHGTGSAHDLEWQLNALGSATSNQPIGGSAPQRIEFTAGVSRIDGMTLDADTLESLGNTLQPHGVAARLDGNTLVLQARSQP
jgi:general secretion pathway protein L